jgi:Mor family transcriptional regulator
VGEARSPDDGSPPRAYANARNILPTPVLHVVQSHFDGGLLWVPPREARKEKTKGHVERNRQILQERIDGASIRFLACKYGLSDERIRQLVRSPKTRINK